MINATALIFKNLHEAVDIINRKSKEGYQVMILLEDDSYILVFSKVFFTKKEATQYVNDYLNA